MAHFAQLDENNVVTQVIVVSNNELLDNGIESESKGIEFCQSLFGADTRWVQTSYNNNFRKRYGSIGHTFRVDLDAFIPPKPIQYPSFVLNPETLDWEPPLPRPTDTVYKWDEATLSWVVVPKPYPSWVAQGDPLVWIWPVPYPTDGKEYKWDEPTISWVEVSQP